MVFHYEKIAREGQEIDQLTDPSGLRIQVSRHGAELISIARRAEDGQWIGFLYRDGDVSPANEGWKNHATLMGYFLHRIKGSRSLYRGHEIRGETHSFLRHKIFAAPKVMGNLVKTMDYHISLDQIAPDEYPGKVEMWLGYGLERGKLRVVFRFKNFDPEPAHISFGLHPGFAAQSLDSANVLLPPGIYIRHFAPENFLSGETAEFHHGGGPMPFPKSELPGSFLLELKNVPSPIFTFEDTASQRCVDLDFREVPYVTLWSDGHAFICVEPCWGLPDHHEQRPFEQKLGIQTISPGGTLTRSFTIAPRLK